MVSLEIPSSLIQLHSGVTTDDAIKETNSWIDKRKTSKKWWPFSPFSETSSALQLTEEQGKQHRKRKFSELQQEFRVFLHIFRSPFAHNTNYLHIAKKYFLLSNPFGTLTRRKSILAMNPVRFLVFSPSNLFLSPLFALQRFFFFHHEHLSPYSGKTGTFIYTSSLKRGCFVTT